MLLALWLCAFCLLPCTADAQQISHRYDADIQDASNRWLPAWQWQWWKAQLYQESQLNPDAVSSVGAAGLCQAMPGTWAEIRQAMRWGTVSPHVARYCIEGGAYYMARMRAVWISPRPESSRRELAQASYNAGAGNILRAQKACMASNAQCTDWQGIAVYLASITGHANAEQTTTYVARIHRWFLLLGSE